MADNPLDAHVLATLSSVTLLVFLLIPFYSVMHMFVLCLPVTHCDTIQSDRVPLNQQIPTTM